MNAVPQIYKTSEHKRLVVKAYKTKNRERIKIKDAVRHKKYNSAHKKQRAETARRTRKVNVQSRLSENLRTRLRKVVKRDSKRGSPVRDLGCSLTELKSHIERQFKKGMRWDNWGVFGWHIDHITPLCCFDLTNRTQFLQAVHYTNLQPLWANENYKKGTQLN